MKLELKHIAPYLPFDLMAVKINDGEIVSTPFVIDGLTADNYVLPDELASSFYLDSIKPTLRPLSQLVDGRYLFEVISMQYVNINHADKCVIKNDGVYYGTTRLTSLNYMRPEAAQALPYYVVQYLLEHHFDVFGLIDKGLAIDINKLKSKQHEARRFKGWRSL